MKVLVKTKGFSFSIGVDLCDTVLDIKKKIEKLRRVPVSKQTLFFQGKLLLHDDFTVQRCKIFHGSFLELFFPIFYEPNRNINNQVLHQTEQSPVPPPPPPSNSAKDIIHIQDSPEKIQDSTVMATRDGYQALHQYPVPSRSIKESLNIQDWPLTTGDISNIPGSSKNQVRIGDIIYGEDQPLTTGHFSNIQSYLPETEISQRINDQDLPARVGSRNQDLVQTSNSMREVINIPDSPVRRSSSNEPPQKMIVKVLPYSRETENNADDERKILVEVDPNDNVETLRNKLVQLQQKLQFDLPQQGYFFIHGQNLLREDQSFVCNCVSIGDTIDIFPGNVTDHDGDSSDTSF